MKKNIINLNIDIIKEGLKDDDLSLENRLYWEDKKRRLLSLANNIKYNKIKIRWYQI